MVSPESIRFMLFPLPKSDGLPSCLRPIPPHLLRHETGMSPLPLAIRFMCTPALMELPVSRTFGDLILVV
jgi:hypothetical protein